MYDREVAARLISSPFTSNLDNALIERELADGFRAGIRAQICAPGQLELIRRVKERFPDSKTRIGMVVSYPYGGMTTRVKCELVRQAREAGMDEVDIAPNVTAAASQDYADVEEEMCRIIEAARGEIRLVPMLWMVKFSFETVDGLCRVYKRLGIDSVKTSAGIHFGEMLVEHIEWLHRNYPEFCIEVAGRTRQREKAEAMFRAGASFIHTGSWRKLSGIGTDPAFDGATKECSAGKFTNYLQEAGK